MTRDGALPGTFELSQSLTVLAPRWDMESNLTSACQLLSLFRNKDALGMSDFALLREESKGLTGIRFEDFQP